MAPVGDRKPPGVSWESWIDRRIRAGQEAGAFDDLPGAGKPLPGLDGQHDDQWWVKQKLRREAVTVLPPAIELRKALEAALEQVGRCRSEDEVRVVIQDINDRIRSANRRGISGPPSTLMPLDVDEVVASWRAAGA